MLITLATYVATCKTNTLPSMRVANNSSVASYNLNITNIQLGVTIIEHYKYLGVTAIQNDLKWHKYIQSITYRANQTLAQSLLKRNLRTPSIQLRERAYLGLVQPKVEYTDNEIFPSCYTIYRRDRPDGYGGVFFGCHNSYTCTHIDIQITCDIVSCKVDLQQSTLLIISVYRPPNNDITYMENLCGTIENLILNHPNSIIWIAGDINLPNINWSNWSLRSCNYSLSLCNLFTDLLISNGFSQLVDTPTRQNNILDIFATNRPSLVTKCGIIPGISDHESVYVEAQLKTVTVHSSPRHVLLWNKADFQHINDLMLQYASDFISVNSVDTLWNSYG